VRVQGTLDDMNKLFANSPLVVMGESVYSQHRITVAPDGFISLPSMPPIDVSGKTLEEIKDAILNRLDFGTKAYNVSVILIHPNSYAYYVSGEVKNAGRYILERPTTLMEAVGAAGGFTEKALYNKVRLLRNGKISIVNMTLDDDEKIQQSNVILKPNDTILVPRKKLPDTLTAMLLLSIISTITGVYVAAK